MIQANELRVGNWIKECDGNCEALTAERFIDFLEFEGILDSIDPVPLSEELLVIFGFEKHVFGGYQFKDIVVVIRNDKNIILYNAMEHRCSFTISRQVQYVHQLQNLVYVLIGEELTIKSDK